MSMTGRDQRRRLCCSMLLIVAFAATTGVDTVRAAIPLPPAPSVGIGPFRPDPSGSGRSWILRTVSPGSGVHAAAIISNLGKAPAQVALYVADGYTWADSTFTVSGYAATLKHAGTWIHIIGPRHLTLPAHSTQTVRLLINVPHTATVGAHAAALVERGPPQLMRLSGGGQVRVVTQVGVRIYITVAGKAIAQVQWQQSPCIVQSTELVCTYNAQNTGTTSLSPNGRLRLTTLWGAPVATGIISTGGVLLPTDSAVVRAHVQRPILGLYQVHSDLSTGKGHLDRVATIFVGPTTKQGAVGGGLFFLSCFLFLFRRRIMAAFSAFTG